MALDDKAKQDMESGLEHAVRLVQTRFAQLEQNVFIPGLESSHHFAKEHPIISTFISIFLILSLFPILSFLGFTLLVSATFYFIAFACAFIISALLITVAGGVLVIILSILFVVSIFLALAVISLFITARLGQHLRSQPQIKKGITDWAEETRGRLSWRSTRATDPNNANLEVKNEVGGGSDEWQAVNNGQS